MADKLKQINLYVSELISYMVDFGAEGDDEADLMDRCGGNVNDAYNYGFEDGEESGKFILASKIKAIIDGEDE